MAATATAAADDPEESLRKTLEAIRAGTEKLTAPDGPFHLAEEEVQHHGTVQRYKCWQRGPNSLVHHTLPELFGDCFARFGDQDLIIRGGENISCAEIEGALFEHQSIAEVAAIGVPHENLGESVAVTIVFKKGEKTPSLEELKQHARSRLAAHKVPAEFFAWQGGALPRGATGKIQKREIREHLSDMRKGKQGVPTSKL
eukprot:TRINITY_DN113606_c0_g1_i1.p1 TRINITY_DN113606_c0_g1~~TRINITY_DN113606_c0_g1_i1.p1  ORF type:complete len:212 (+),score=46.71 TRINITY_DN113606_c0_g1_i1:38-637(+)